MGKKNSIMKTGALLCALLFAAVVSGCTIDAIDPCIEAGDAAVRIAYIDLGSTGSIEFLETQSGELIVGAMFGSPDTELVGIDESPLAVYRHYTGEEPPARLVAAYERSIDGLAVCGPVAKSDAEMSAAVDPASGSRMSATEFTNNYFNTSAVTSKNFKTIYTNRTGLVRTQRNCFTLGIIVHPYRGSVRANLKTLYGDTWSTEYTRLVAEGSVYQAYTGGAWRTRIGEAVESDGDGFHFAYYGMNTYFVCVSLGGSSSTDIHPVVSDEAANEGLPLNDNNWKKDSGDGVCSSGDAERVAGKLASWSGLNSPPRANLNLLVVGKSAGGVLAWNTFRRHFGTIDDFNKAAMLLVDPHGSVLDDDNVGPYCDSQSLYWPSSFSTDRSFFRVYNIYQHSDGLTGASFPSSNVYKNIKLSGGGVNHDNIPGKEETRELIREAMRFLKP